MHMQPFFYDNTIVIQDATMMRRWRFCVKDIELKVVEAQNLIRQ